MCVWLHVIEMDKEKGAEENVNKLKLLETKDSGNRVKTILVPARDFEFTKLSSFSQEFQFQRAVARNNFIVNFTPGPGFIASYHTAGCEHGCKSVAERVSVSHASR